MSESPRVIGRKVVAVCDCGRWIAFLVSADGAAWIVERVEGDDESALRTYALGSYYPTIGHARMDFDSMPGESL